MIPNAKGLWVMFRHVEGYVVSTVRIGLDKSIECCDGVAESLCDNDGAVLDCDQYIKDGSSCFGVGFHHAVYRRMWITDDTRALGGYADESIEEGCRKVDQISELEIVYTIDAIEHCRDVRGALRHGYLKRCGIRGFTKVKVTEHYSIEHDELRLGIRNSSTPVGIGVEWVALATEQIVTI